MTEKEIRFITPDYKELFRIPDGGYITINHSDGEQLVRKCKFIDETHTKVGTNSYHICQFAERIQRNGITCAPCPEPEVVQGYLITDRMPVNDKVFVLAHNPDAVQPYVTWQSRNDRPGYDEGHYGQIAQMHGMTTFTGPMQSAQASHMITRHCLRSKRTTMRDRAWNAGYKR